MFNRLSTTAQTMTLPEALQLMRIPEVVPNKRIPEAAQSIRSPTVQLMILAKAVQLSRLYRAILLLTPGEAVHSTTIGFVSVEVNMLDSHSRVERKSPFWKTVI